MSDPIQLVNILRNMELDSILDNLPLGITVQTTDRVIIYENKYAIELLGSGIGNLCYRRWSYLEDYEDKPCKECPGHISLEDGKEHSLLRKTVNKAGDPVLFEIMHHPLYDDNGQFNRFIEVIKPITKNSLINLRVKGDKEEDFQISLVRFGNLGGEIIISDDLNFITNKDEMNAFATQIAAFWFAAIGQGHQWPEGLFGPLPVLDYYELLSFGYSSVLASQITKDERMKDRDLVILLIFTDRNNDLISKNRQVITPMIDQLFAKIKFMEDIDETFLSNIKTIFHELRDK